MHFHDRGGAGGSAKAPLPVDNLLTAPHLLLYRCRMNILGIVFDKDGTLVDFDATWGRAAHRVIAAMSRDDRRAYERLSEAMHFVSEERRFLPTSPMIAGSTADYAGLWAEILGREDGTALIEEIDRRFGVETLESLTAIGEPAAVFAALRGLGLRLGIATNDAERSARAQCETLGLTPHLDFIAGYDSGYGAKPAPGMIHAFVREIGCSPGQVALVGDSLHDLEAARAAGAVAIAVLSGPARRAVLDPHADHVIGSIADLPALVVRLNGGHGSGRPIRVRDRFQ